MNLKDKKRLGRILLVALITVQPLLIGAKFFDLQLRNVNRPLVDMTKLVNGNSITAKSQEVSKTRDSEEESRKTVSEEEKSPAADDKARTDGEEKTTGIAVRVSGERISLNGRPVTLEGFEKSFEDVYQNGARVTVIDDYADYRVMLKIIEYFRGKGINYTGKEM